MKAKIVTTDLFPRILTYYTEDGVAEIEEASVIIEKMAESVSAAELVKFLSFINTGNFGLAYDMFRYIQENKS
ncbi:hypothetical protein AB4114_11200 [Paenibacillus sp. 2RAB27]|uniref:hypothetical protein n=1 Tax=Paenibacillus sp. 2RAB27 TaxID=3232991 RepID=UPI003F946E82